MTDHGHSEIALPPHTVGPKSQPKSPAISTVQAPTGSPADAKLGGVNGGKSRYPRASGSSPIRSLELPAAAAAATVSNIVAQDGMSAPAPPDAVACSMFSWGNAKKVFVTQQNRDKGQTKAGKWAADATSAIAADGNAGEAKNAAFEAKLQKSLLPDQPVEPAQPVEPTEPKTFSSARSSGRATAGPGGRGGKVVGGRGKRPGFNAPRRTFNPPRPSAKAAPKAIPLSASDSAATIVASAAPATVRRESNGVLVPDSQPSQFSPAPTVAASVQQQQQQ